MVISVPPPRSNLSPVSLTLWPKCIFLVYWTIRYVLFSSILHCSPLPLPPWSYGSLTGIFNSTTIALIHSLFSPYFIILVNLKHDFLLRGFLLGSEAREESRINPTHPPLWLVTCRFAHGGEEGQKPPQPYRETYRDTYRDLQRPTET